MASGKGFFYYSIGKKVLMALSGLFLVFFLLEHLVGNSLLVIDDPAWFNGYAFFMGHWMNIPIRVMELVLLSAIVIHVVDAFMLSGKNKEARPIAYAVNASSANSSWFSRNMLLTGTFILLFLVLHMANFLLDARFGVNINLSGSGIADYGHDLHAKVRDHFALWWYSALYVVVMIFLGLHLNHGFQSAFQSLGANHKKYTPLIKKFGTGYAIAVPAGFIAIAVTLFVKSL
jgi:succinate dehydrogenase / fumarate reductase, cytochrome b subunit